VWCGAKTTSVRGSCDGGRADVDHGDRSARIEFDRLLVAVGRTPSSSDLGLDRIGALTDQRGAVRVDPRLRTTAAHVYAVGDVTGAMAFTHVAAYHARVATVNALFGMRRRVDYAAVPRVTFTDPEVAGIGLTEAEARSRWRDPAVVSFDYAELNRAVAERRAYGFAILIGDPRGRLVGATIAAPGGERGEDRPHLPDRARISDAVRRSRPGRRRPAARPVRRAGHPAGRARCAAGTGPPGSPALMLDPGSTGRSPATAARPSSAACWTSWPTSSCTRASSSPWRSCPRARLACVALLATYLVNNVALLAFSSVIERLGLRLGDERSLRLTTGLAEGAETFAVYVLFCVLPGASETIAWGFAAVVAVTAVQRVARAAQILNPRSAHGAQLRSTSTQSDA